MQTQQCNSHTNPDRQPTGADLDGVLADLGRAYIALCGMRTLVHTHSTRQVLEINEDAVEYLLEKRDELFAAVDATLASYARAVDPSGGLASLVEDAIDMRPEPELVPVDDDTVFGIRQMHRDADGNVVEVRRYS